MQDETLKDARPGTVLAHLSDPHLPLAAGVALRAVLNKRLLSLLSWRLKRHRRHLWTVLDPLIADLRAHAPGAIAVTGDLTNLGLDDEYRRARAWLDTVGEAARVMVIPGNHDALISGAWEAGAARWHPYWQGDEAHETDVGRAFPWLRRRGGMALIGLSSAVASRPGLAVGAVGATQRARLATLLARTRAEGLARVVMVHHPPLDGTVTARKRLRDAAELRAVLAHEGVEMVLHGHSHRSHMQALETTDGPAPVIGVPSASSMHLEAAAYNLYRIVTVAGGLRIDLTTRRMTPEGAMETGDSQRLTLARAHIAGGV